jgi:NAD(P)-dependent dehydrogenase (short-subunit alcohol dehydrogenase family)
MGLGAALAHGLAGAGWSLVIDARDEGALSATAAVIDRARVPGTSLIAVAGDVTDAGHRARLALEAERLGNLELLVNNASTLGPSPLPPLVAYPLAALRAVVETNLLAPLGLIQAVRAQLEHADRPRVLNLTSDASVEAYPGWGGYGASKAALDHLGAVLAAEEPRWQVWSVDPGDLRTRMHQEAFPGEDISDRPEPITVVPVLLALVGSDRPSGRVRLAELVPSARVS